MQTEVQINGTETKTERNWNWNQDKLKLKLNKPQIESEIKTENAIETENKPAIDGHDGPG